MEDSMIHTPISAWAEDERPREKLLNKGLTSLSDAELLAILMSTGYRGHSALDIARSVLELADGNLIALSRMNIGELRRIRGVGMAKAVSLVAALELGRRRRYTEALSRKAVKGSKDAFELVYDELADSHHEKFIVLLLNRANRFLRKVLVSEGGFAGTVADPKRIFGVALEAKASAIILAHNHPSGNLKPSDSDIRLTRKLQQSGEFLDLPVLDHLIIGEENYLSFADEGLI